MIAARGATIMAPFNPVRYPDSSESLDVTERFSGKQIIPCLPLFDDQDAGILEFFHSAALKFLTLNKFTSS